MRVNKDDLRIIQLSELLENYNLAQSDMLVLAIIQLSELLENYNEKSAHRWVGNFSLQILTDLHPSKTLHHTTVHIGGRHDAVYYGCLLADTSLAVGYSMKPNNLFHTHSTYSFHDAEQGNRGL